MPNPSPGGLHLLKLIGCTLCGNWRSMQEAAAAVIQKTFRRWVARKRFEHAQWAIRAWHREVAYNATPCPGLPPSLTRVLACLLICRDLGALRS